MKIVRYSITSSILLALAATGCAGADESGQFAEESDQFAGEATSEKGIEGAGQVESFDYAPESDSNEKAVDPTDLAAKGAVTLTLGSTFYRAVTIPAHGTVTYQTSNRVNVDPVMVLFIRTNPWGGAFGGSPYTAQGQANTLAFDDDGAGNLNSKIVYTNPDGVPRNAYLMVFNYGNTITGGAGTVDINGFGTVNIRAGSARISGGTLGYAFTSGSGGDPWLVAFDPDIGGGDTVWNDDSPVGGTTESRINGFTNQLEWVVGHAFSGSGTTTVNY